MLALIAALPRELAGVVRELRSPQRHDLPAGRVTLGSLAGHTVVVGRCGVGEDRARRLADGLLQRYPVDALVSVGFAGALTGGLAAGDLVLACRLHRDGGPPVPPLDPDRELLERLAGRAAAAGWRARRGASVSAGRMVTAMSERARLAGRHGAMIVDMEGYGLAAECAAHGVPFASLRAVSDTVGDHHPALERALEEGTFHVGRAVQGFATHPRDLAKLPRLAANARRASRALAGFVLSAAPAATEGRAA